MRYEEFTAADKRRVLELMVTNEEILISIYDRLFSPTNLGSLQTAFQTYEQLAMSKLVTPKAPKNPMKRSGGTMSAHVANEVHQANTGDPLFMQFQEQLMKEDLDRVL